MRRGSKCARNVCAEICSSGSVRCPAGYTCDSETGTCQHLGTSSCSYDSECPGTGSYCKIAAGETYGTCEHLCHSDTDCEGCTYCNLDNASANYAHCVAYEGLGACNSAVDCPDPAFQVCSRPRETCEKGICVRSCSSGFTNCKAEGRICNSAPTSPTYGMCIDPLLTCIPCADDDDCGYGGRCGWRQDNRYKILSGCCEWAGWADISLCHNVCTGGTTCFPAADACGQTACPSGQCTAPDGSCGPCTCTNTTPYCVPLPNDATGQGTCCAGDVCVRNRCEPRLCGRPDACIQANGLCGPCLKCENPTSCGLGLPPCCSGSTCKIEAGQKLGLCQALGCYGKTCTPGINDCCAGTPDCFIPNYETSRDAYCF